LENGEKEKLRHFISQRKYDKTEIMRRASVA
jgi:hypothetical protein